MNTKTALKYDSIIENYINGNISDTKQKVKKLSKVQRKELHQHCAENFGADATQFFYNLI